MSMAMSLASAQRCLSLDTRVCAWEARIRDVSEGVGSMAERMDHIGLLVAAQSRAHRRLVGTVTTLQGVVVSMDERLRRVESASALRDALVDVACALAAWRASGALAWAARRMLPAHAAGTLVLGRRGVALVELVRVAAAVPERMLAEWATATPVRLCDCDCHRNCKGCWCPLCVIVPLLPYPLHCGCVVA